MAQSTDKYTILVVDDSSDTLDFVRRSLSRCGYGVVIAASGNDALSILETNDDITAILSDVEMPNGGGLDLLTTIRAKRNMIPFFLMTARASISKADAVRLGADGIFEKPFHIANFTSKVQLLINDLEKTKNQKPG